MSEARGLPVTLHLQGRTCLVVGAGAVGRRKALALVAAGAQVRVVDPRVAGDAELPYSVEPRAFADGDLDGVFLVVAATDRPEVNEAVQQEARQRGVLCARADQAAAGDFSFSVVFRQGALQLAIGTGGNSPALALRVRARLATQYGPEWGPLTALAGRLRRALLATEGHARRSGELLDALLAAGVEGRLAVGDDVKPLLQQVLGAELTTRLEDSTDEESA